MIKPRKNTGTRFLEPHKIRAKRHLIKRIGCASTVYLVCIQRLARKMITVHRNNSGAWQTIQNHLAERGLATARNTGNSHQINVWPVLKFRKKSIG